MSTTAQAILLIFVAELVGFLVLRRPHFLATSWTALKRMMRSYQLESPPAPKELEAPRGHRTAYAFRDGTKSCTRGRPRVLEVRSILPPHEVVGWLCLECGESVDPYTDGARATIISEQQLEAEQRGLDTYEDRFTGQTIHVKTRQRVDPRTVQKRARS